MNTTFDQVSSIPYDHYFASVYDAIYENKKHYRRESERAHLIIERHKQSQGNDLLDVGCGTGAHAEHLRQWYSVEGLDLSRSQLSIARGRLPDLVFHLADMTEFDLKKSYDVVTCLFNSLAHILTLKQLAQAVKSMTNHLRPGGILLIEPWIGPEAFVEGMIEVDIMTSERKIVRVTRAVRSGRIVTFLLTHFVGHDGRYETPFTIQQKAALYGLEEYLGACRSADLSVSYESSGLTGRRGVIVGRK